MARARFGSREFEVEIPGILGARAAAMGPLPTRGGPAASSTVKPSGTVIGGTLNSASNGGSCGSTCANSSSRPPSESQVERRVLEIWIRVRLL